MPRQRRVPRVRETLEGMRGCDPRAIARWCSQNERLRMLRMSRGIRLSYEYPEGYAKHDRSVDLFERVAPGPRTSSPIVRGSVCRRARSLARCRGDPIDELHRVLQRREPWLEERVVEAGSPCRRSSVGFSRSRERSGTSFALCIEEETDVVDQDTMWLEISGPLVLWHCQGLASKSFTTQGHVTE